MGTLVYFFKEAVRGFFEAKLMTFVSIVSIAMTLMFASIIVLGIANVGSLLGKLSEQADIAVYLEDNVVSKKGDVESLIASVKKMPQVEAVGFIDKDSAFQRFSSIYGEDMLEAVDENPLPASLDLYLKNDLHNKESVIALQQQLKELPGVESVQTAWDGISTIERFHWVFIIGSIAISLIMVLLLHFMIANTIKLTIYARKELVRNMHFVGATDFFISMPFIIEGMLQGFIGGTVSVILLLMTRLVFSQYSIAWELEFLPLITIFAGVVFGWIGSVSAVRKFLV